MSSSIQDQRRVFVAYRALFDGPNAQVRQSAAIKKVLESGHAGNAKKAKLSSISLSPTVSNLGLTKVVAILKVLLEKRVFESELKAKIKFPSLYETSPEQDARHEASDAGAARAEAEAVQEAERLNQIATADNHVDDAKVDELDEANARSAGHNQNADTAEDVKDASDEQESQSPGGLKIPSLYPIELPFKIQHKVLAKTQRLLEECCFAFTEQHAPMLLKECAWDCPEAIELNVWPAKILQYTQNHQLSVLKETQAATLCGVSPIRHAAVHRLRISAKGIIQMIDGAVKFAETLSDPFRAFQLQELALEIRNKMRSQEMYNNFLETNLKKDLDRIQSIRQELAAQERRAISSMAEENEANMQLVGGLIEARLDDIFGIDPANKALYDAIQDYGIDTPGSKVIDEEHAKEPVRVKREPHPEVDGEHDNHDDGGESSELLVPDVGPSTHNSLLSGFHFKFPAPRSIKFHLEPVNEIEIEPAGPSSEKVASCTDQDEDLSMVSLPHANSSEEDSPYDDMVLPVYASDNGNANGTPMNGDCCEEVAQVNCDPLEADDGVCNPAERFDAAIKAATEEQVESDRVCEYVILDAEPELPEEAPDQGPIEPVALEEQPVVSNQCELQGEPSDSGREACPDACPQPPLPVTKDVSILSTIQEIINDESMDSNAFRQLKVKTNAINKLKSKSDKIGEDTGKKDKKKKKQLKEDAAKKINLRQKMQAKELIRDDLFRDVKRSIMENINMKLESGTLDDAILKEIKTTLENDPVREGRVDNWMI